MYCVVYTCIVFVQVNVTLPRSTVRNGTLYAHIFLGAVGNSKLSQFARQRVLLTQYAVRRRATVSLLNLAQSSMNSSTNSSSNSTTPKPATNKQALDSSNSSSSEPPMTHWKPKLSLHLAETDMVFDRNALPGDIMHLFRFDNTRYLPILYVNDMAVRYKDLVPVEKNATDMLLKIHYSPYMLGRVRVWAAFTKSFETLQMLGFKDKDMDEVKELFHIQLHFLALTFFVSFVHILFDFLAFKNDINYWRSRKNMVGLSRNVIFYRCFSQFVIFLYLVDEDTSLLVTIPSGIACFIELWKVTKALKLSVHWRGFSSLPKVEFGALSSVEAETQVHDSQAFRYIKFALIPLVLGCAVYSLLYLQYNSWWSWIVHSAANGIYVFGFLMMLPQLFVNYKLKSVAHLPWRVFTYKAFNTFIDDVFAFIITMPTSHRIAVFRDDLVFFVYLYQRWLYPVDMKRANEFGVSYDNDDDDGTPPSENTPDSHTAGKLKAE